MGPFGMLEQDLIKTQSDIKIHPPPHHLQTAVVNNSKRNHDDLSLSLKKVKISIH